MAKSPRGFITYMPPELAYTRMVFGGDGDSASQLTTFTVPSTSRPGRMYHIAVSWVDSSAGCPCEGGSYNYDVNPLYEHTPDCHAPTHKSRANWEAYATELEREYFRVYGRRLGPSILRPDAGLCAHLILVKKCLKRRKPDADGPTYYQLFQATANAHAAILREKPDFASQEKQSA